MKKILTAGATGYLGSYIAGEVKKQGYYSRVLVRNPAKFEQFGLAADEIIPAEITDKRSLQGCCKDVDAVISSVGITRQKDGLSYMDVDYQANLNLLEIAMQNGVKKFIYISVLNGRRLKRLGICAAKEKFVEALENAGIDFASFVPTVFFGHDRIL